MKSRVIKKMIRPITAMTIKAPKPIPALKMPATASQELKVEATISKINDLRIFIFFIV